MSGKRLLPGKVIQEWMEAYNVSFCEFEMRAQEEGRTEDWFNKIESNTFNFRDCEILSETFHNGVKYWVNVMVEYWKELEATV